MVNQVCPDNSRVDADELTYNLHILARFAIEKDLIEGCLQVADLLERWNHEMKELLGLPPSVY